VIDHLPKNAVQELKHSLSEKRFNHSLNVMQTALNLADAWENEYPIDRCLLAWAALFHDCAKELGHQEERHLLENHEIQYGLELMQTPSLVHAPLGAMLLEVKWDVHDPDVLTAVAYHPTGHPELSPIGWAVYLADYLEPGRTYFFEREEMYQAALKDPLDGLRRVTTLRINTVKQLKKPINPAVCYFKEYLDSIRTLEVVR
jgi:predicted HD superfamily hydrolase involved in NAD metabolism